MLKFILLYILAMTNQDTLREIQRGYRLEKPNYPGDVSPDKLNGIYGGRVIFRACNLMRKFRNYIINECLLIFC